MCSRNSYLTPHFMRTSTAAPGSGDDARRYTWSGREQASETAVSIKCLGFRFGGLGLERMRTAVCARASCLCVRVCACSAYLLVGMHVSSSACAMHVSSSAYATLAGRRSVNGVEHTPHTIHTRTSRTGRQTEGQTDQHKDRLASRHACVLLPMCDMHVSSSQTEGQTDEQKGRLTNRQRDRQTHRQPDRQTQRASTQASERESARARAT